VTRWFLNANLIWLLHACDVPCGIAIFCWHYHVSPSALQMLSAQSQVQTNPFLAQWQPQLSISLFWTSYLTNNARRKIVHSTSGCSREHVAPCFDYKGSQWNKYREWCTKVNILHITVTYLTATINRKTRKRQPESGTDGFSQTQKNLPLDGYRYGFGLTRSSGSGLLMGP